VIAGVAQTDQEAESSGRRIAHAATPPPTSTDDRRHLIAPRAIFSILTRQFILHALICLAATQRGARTSAPLRVAAIACQQSKACWVLVFSFPNSVWERRPRNSVSRLPRGHRTGDAKQSFAKIGSQTELGNQENQRSPSGRG